MCKYLKNTHRKLYTRIVIKEKNGVITRKRVKNENYLPLRPFARSVASLDNRLGHAANVWLCRKRGEKPSP